MSLTNKQKQFLKAKAHELKPIILLGGNGLTEGVMAEIDLALEHHELIKVKVPSIDREEKVAVMDAIVREAKADKVQHCFFALKSKWFFARPLFGRRNKAHK